QDVRQRVGVPVIAVRPRCRAVGADVEHFLSSVRVFQQLDPQLLGRIAAIAQERSYERGDVIVRSRGLGVELFVVRSGQVEAWESPERKRLLGPGEVFGEIAILEHTPRTAAVQALEPTTCL